MIKVIGVRFRTAGKIYFFDPLELEIKKGDHVIVETARGIEFGTVVAGIKEVEEDKVIQPLKPVIRIATERDVEQEAANKEKERDAFKICLEKIHKHELEMKLIDAEYTFDNNKVLFYFTADGRIDFRELVKDLASVFKTRIELRQIGVRDETKILGGIGICGRPLCCHSYLADFIPVSIKMAKEQNLSLNPTKISGVCGRLMCCLKNEEETYEELNRRLPNVGDYVTTEDGMKGEVQSVNVLRQLVKVVVENNDEKEIREYDVDKLTFKKKQGKNNNVELSPEELKELERLEKEDLQDSAPVTPERAEENKPEKRSENRYEKRREFSDSRPENRQERRREYRQERRNDFRQEGRHERRNDFQQEGHHERRNDFQQEGRHERKNDFQQEGHYERRNDFQQEGRRERRNDFQQEGRHDRRGDFHRHGHQDGKYDRRHDNRQNGRHDRRPRREYREDRTGRNAKNHDDQTQG